MTGTQLTAAEQLSNRVTGREQMAQIARLLPDGIDGARVVQGYLAAVRDSKALQKCSIESHWAALLDCARMGLWPGPHGHVYLIPYGTTAKAMPGYRGLIAQLKRQGGVVAVTSTLVYEHEEFEATMGLRPDIRHTRRLDPDRGPWVACYAVAYYRGGTPPQFEIMTRGEISKIRDNHGNKTTWEGHEEEMARKTVIRRLAKYVGTDESIGASFEILDREIVDVTPMAQGAVNEAHERARQMARGES